MKESPKAKRLYKVLYFLMDVESLMWDIADFLIKPVAKLRQKIASKIGKILGIKEEENDPNIKHLL